MLNSDYRPLIEVPLPDPSRGRQHYMHSFDLKRPSVPEGFEDYLHIVTALCLAAGATEGEAHATFDEKIVLAGMSQRKPMPHVDGCFTRGYWGHGVWQHGPTWFHNCNNISITELKRMPVIIAASAEGCRAWKGHFDTQPKEDGDLSHLELSGGEVLPANVGYLLSPDCIHESMIMERDTPRTFLRIALPNNVDYGF